MESGGKTIAVLGNGFNHIFPKENKGLYRDIIDNEGLVISEYPPNVKARSEYFLERNRIVSGIALGILVVEAKYRSGTSVTAKFAKEQDRKIFVVPHEIDDRNGIGTNKMIREGAVLVTSTKDIIKEFEFIKYKKIVQQKVKNRINKTKLKEKNIKEDKNKVKFNDKEYQKIYNLIYEGPIKLSQIIMEYPGEVSKINNILFNLELEGYIEKIAGGYKCI